ncbi:MAG: DUF6884 domain-containing protein [Promethearchaeia archaeon]
MKLLVVSSCTKSKKFQHGAEATYKELTKKESIEKFVSQFPKYSCPAREMYEGAQHKNLKKGIDKLKEIIDIDFYIISAGIGLISAEKVISAYDCTFARKSKAFIRERSQKLEIRKDFEQLVQENSYDLIYLALGKKYLQSIEDWDHFIDDLTIAFTETNNPHVLSLKANNQQVSKFSDLGYTIHGVVGFKGDLFRIIAEKIFQTQNPKKFLTNLLKNKQNLKKFIVKIQKVQDIG